jgi:hypothetical protein
VGAGRSSVASAGFVVLDFDDSAADVDLVTVSVDAGSFLRDLVSSLSGSPVLDLDAAAAASRSGGAS